MQRGLRRQSIINYRLPNAIAKCRIPQYGLMGVKNGRFRFADLMFHFASHRAQVARRAIGGGFVFRQFGGDFPILEPLLIRICL